VCHRAERVAAVGRAASAARAGAAQLARVRPLLVRRLSSARCAKAVRAVRRVLAGAIVVGIEALDQPHVAQLGAHGRGEHERAERARHEVEERWLAAHAVEREPEHVCEEREQEAERIPHDHEYKVGGPARAAAVAATAARCAAQEVRRTPRAIEAQRKADEQPGHHHVAQAKHGVPAAIVEARHHEKDGHTLALKMRARPPIV